MSGLSKNKDLVDSYHECLGLREAELQEKIEQWHSKDKKWEQVSWVACSHFLWESGFGIQEYGKLQKECEAKELECEAKEMACEELRRVCGELMARTALARAENTVREELIVDIKEKYACGKL